MMAGLVVEYEVIVCRCCCLLAMVGFDVGVSSYRFSVRSIVM